MKQLDDVEFVRRLVPRLRWFVKPNAESDRWILIVVSLVDALYVLDCLFKSHNRKHSIRQLLPRQVGLFTSEQ